MVRHLSSTGAWNTMPTDGIGRSTGRPSTSTRPRLAGRSPAMILSSVDLPQPDGPTMASISPRATWRSTSRRASTGPEAPG